ncbi:MAG: hypothetical protein WC180_01360 [Candidatus Paceibacterota bacterium]
MKSIWKYLGLISVYALIFIPPVIREPESGARFNAVFVAVFLFLVLLAIFSGSFFYKKILSALGIRVLSSGGDIIKTDFGHNLKNVFARNLINITGDAFFNLVFILFLIFFAVSSAAVASDAASSI